MSILKSLKWFMVDQFTFYVGGSDSPGPQTNVTNTSNLPEYVRPYVEGMLGSAQQQIYNMDSSGNISGFKPYTPYSTNMQDYQAGFSPMQQQAFQGAANLKMPGQYQTGSNLAGAAGTGSLGVADKLANTNYNPSSASYLNASAPGMQAPSMQSAKTDYNPNLSMYQMSPASQVSTQDFTQGNTAQQYMNPYLQQSLSPQLDEMRRQYGISGTQQQSQATQRGAFGGSREALMASENNRNMNTAMNNVIGQGYNNAYNNAQQQFNTQQNANLQAQQANQQAGLTTGQQNLGAALGVQQLGAQTGLQTSLANLNNNQQANVQNQAAQLQANNTNAQQNLQAQLANQQANANVQQLKANQQQFGANLGLQGQQAALQGYGQANQAASTLGQIGQQQLQGQQGILGLQNQYGAQQQAQQQNTINQAIQNYATAQQYPMMQLGNMSNLLHGLPMQSSTTQTYQAQPSTLNTIAGLGTGIAGVSQLMKAEGGTVKSYKGGGITSLANRQIIAEDLNPEQLAQVIKNRTIPPIMGKAIQEDNIREVQAARMAGIDKAPTNLPTQTMAEGGIVAFSTGGAPKFGLKPENLEKTDTTGLQDILANYMNKDTNKPYTEEEVTNERRDKEAKLGIKDLYADREQEFEKTKADIANQKNSALGFGLLNASSKILENANKPGFTGIGAGIGGFNEAYAPALKDIRAQESGLRKEKFLAQDAHNAMLQAQMNGDDKAFTDAQNAFVTHKTNIINAENQDKGARNAVRVEAAKAEYDYNTKLATTYADNESKYKSALIAAKNGDFGHVNQAFTAGISSIHDAQALHDSKYKNKEVLDHVANVERYNKYIANKEPIPEGVKQAYIASKPVVDEMINSQSNIDALKANHDKYIKYMGDKMGIPIESIPSLAGNAKLKNGTGTPGAVDTSNPLLKG